MCLVTSMKRMEALRVGGPSMSMPPRVDQGVNDKGNVDGNF